MTLGDLLEALAERGATLTSDGSRLKYHGRRLPEGDEVRRALGSFLEEVLWLLLEQRLCVFCPRLLAQGDVTCCATHRRAIDALPAPWDDTVVERAATIEYAGVS